MKFNERNSDIHLIEVYIKLNDRDTLKKKARFNMKNVNKQKKICSNHASSFLFSPVNKSVKIGENPQFNAKKI